MRPLSFRAAVGLAASSLAAAAALSCAQQPINVPVRSLEHSGRVAFWCLSADKDNPGAALDTCASYYPHDPNKPYNHLTALVTQPIRGEIALIDLLAGTVVDMDPSKPGFNFVPTGANPVDVVTTPGSTAAFVSSASATSQSIWAIPSRTLMKGPAQLNSFAACALPSAPGEMKVLVQPGASGATQADCAGNPLEGDHPQGDLSKEGGPAGVRKLLVSLPDEGMLAVLDAQKILDKTPGSFEACDPDAPYIQLQVKLPPSWPQEVWPTDLANERAQCSLTQPADVSTSSGYVPRPSSFALDEETSTLYVSDESAPVIHVLDVSDPCNIVERDPLLPRSAEDPTRVVVTRGIAVSPTTTDGKKFVYAVDLREGSVMAFDVSPGSSERTPLVRKNAQTDPFGAPDRISLSVPVQSISFALRDSPIADQTSGVAQVGTQCNPADDTAVGAGYRTSSDYTTGAGPRNLRGIFGFLALTNGQVVVVDVDDFDAPCRRPKDTGTGACRDETFASYQGADGEASCDVIERNQLRDANYFGTDQASGAHVPALQTYPVLSLDNAVLATDQSDDGKKHPRLLAPIKTDPSLLIGGQPLDPTKVQTNPDTADQNMLLFDYREPRVHFEQNWSVSFEGSLPGFVGHVGRIDSATDATGRTVFWDSGAFFCDHGVHDLDAARNVGEKRGVDAPSDWAQSHTDVVQLTSDFLDANDPYWPSVSGKCSLLQCRQTFGLPDTPTTARDLPIVEAYQDHLVVENVSDFTRCCFPFLPTYGVRASNQWLVTGSSTGFLHKVVTDPNTARCIDTCDPTRDYYDARAYELDPKTDAIPTFDDPKVFRNPLLQFVVWKGGAPSERDMTFSFSTLNGFVPLMISLASSTAYVQPQSMQLVPQTGQLAVADGATQGLLLVDLSTLAVVATYF